LDFLCGLAELARRHNYVRPLLRTDRELNILNGRHPVVERVLGAHNFIPNDTRLDGGSRRLAVLTGPNMGGKSTYLRQIGLIQLLAQAGSFVPAEKAELPLVDRIFTRIGAADDLSRGDSTFMVEMREASVIVRKASSKSLVLIDEIGRGTATSDGLALATAISEWLHDDIGCSTVFATHFHQLTKLAEEKEGAFCLSVGVIETGKEIEFTHRIEERPADRSYGIEVARLAGLPERLLGRAESLLQRLEAEEGEMKERKEPLVKSTASCPSDAGATLHRELVDKIRSLAPETMTPLQALNELAGLSELLEK
jgi:DNA mismatch repair protein MutS